MHFKRKLEIQKVFVKINMLFYQKCITNFQFTTSRIIDLLPVVLLNSAILTAKIKINYT